MRIGLIVAPWLPVPPTGYGGTELVVDALARGFEREGHDVLLAASADSTCPVELLPGADPSDPAGISSNATELSHVVRAYAGMAGQVDLVHDHTLVGPLYRHRPADLPVVATLHGPLNPQLARIFHAAAPDTALVAISRNQLRDTPGLSATVIHHGIELGNVPVGSGSGGYAVFLGRLSPDKGVVEAVLTARAAGIPLKIAAKMREPSELRYFHDAVEPLLASDDEFVGELGGAEKYRLLGDALALLSPIQWQEPFGLVMIEAMATGTPVVTTPIGSAPEVVESGLTGYFGRTIEQLAAVLPYAADLDRAAVRARAEQRFSAARMVADHLALYERLLGNDWHGRRHAETGATASVS
ncbi:MAG: glycosyltransferase family 4 protein [Actinomycetota bacterium]|nr:glycosyltransferase family 4 protein [Actinomycetota bacterium]